MVPAQPSVVHTCDPGTTATHSTTTETCQFKHSKASKAWSRARACMHAYLKQFGHLVVGEDGGGVGHGWLCGTWREGKRRRDEQQPLCSPPIGCVFNILLLAPRVLLPACRLHTRSPWSPPQEWARSTASWQTSQPQAPRAQSSGPAAPHLTLARRLQRTPRLPAPPSSTPPSTHFKPNLRIHGPLPCGHPVISGLRASLSGDSIRALLCQANLASRAHPYRADPPHWLSPRTSMRYGCL